MNKNWAWMKESGIEQEELEKMIMDAINFVASRAMVLEDAVQSVQGKETRILIQKPRLIKKSIPKFDIDSIVSMEKDRYISLAEVTIKNKSNLSTSRLNSEGVSTYGHSALFIIAYGDGTLRLSNVSHNGYVESETELKNLLMSIKKGTKYVPPMYEANAIDKVVAEAIDFVYTIDIKKVLRKAHGLDEIVELIGTLNSKELQELSRSLNEDPIFSHSIEGKPLVEEVRDAIIYVINNSERHFEVQEHRNNIGGMSITASVLGTKKEKKMRQNDEVYSTVIEDTSEIKSMVSALMNEMKSPFLNVGLVYEIHIIPEVLDDLNTKVFVEVLSGVKS